MQANGFAGAFSPEIIKEIEKILSRGNTAEVKKEKGRLVIVEIKRTARIMTPVIGQNESRFRSQSGFAIVND